MAGEVLALRAAPELPDELYRDIAEKLHGVKEKHTLLRLAPVSKAWCAESQRVLFRTISEDSCDSNNHETAIHTHMLLLEAIIRNPTRLGPYVQKYEQCYLISHPMLLVAQASSRLWNLTAEALPALVNLKHLFIIPCRDHAYVSQDSLLVGCTFKLKSLIWGFDSDNACSIDPFIEFLRTQQDIVHLEVGSDFVMQDFSWLPEDVCPNLISVSCRLDSAGRVSKRRKVVGLIMSLPTEPYSRISPLPRLKYLSTVPHCELISNVAAVAPNITLLELALWALSTVQNLSGLMKLRVLALLRLPGLPPSRTFSLPVLKNADTEHKERMQVAIASFRQCPNLEYVIIQDIRRGEEPRRFRKLSMPRLDQGPGTTSDIQCEEFLIEYEFGMSWWTGYGV